MARCVIVSAASINNYSKIKSYLKDDDYFIFCDGGLNHIKKLNVSPNLIVGDFDSFDKSKLKDLSLSNTETISLPQEKDDTDTFYAIKEGLKRGYKDFLLLGVIGNRFDHSLCNISSLLFLDEKDCTASILDDYSIMTLLTPKKEIEIEDNISYFSLMNIKGDVKGVTIKNAKYPLNNSDIKASYSYGISNEVIKGKRAIVSIKEGVLLLLKIW